MTDLKPRTTLRRETRVSVDTEGHAHIIWAVVTDTDAVSFTVRLGKGRGNRDDLPWGIDHHSSEPDPDAYTFGPNECTLLAGGKCWSDGSSLQASELWDEVRSGGGEDRIWTVLEDRFARWIEKQDEPVAVAFDEERER